jgi:LPS export ABC transporter protein LptC
MRRMEFVVAVLLFGATVVAGCNRKTAPPIAVRTSLAVSADQVMYGTKFNLTDAGLARAQLEADSAFFFDDNTRVELRNVATTFFTTSGARDAYLTSKRGTYNSRTGTMIARDSVVVVTEEGRQLVTNELKYDQQVNEVSSDKAFVLTEPGRRLEGVGFRSDPNMQNVRILKTREGSMGAITLPGQ